ncbi:hypothetical protein MtrunA17_Chr5g0422071 [Medicago truncatula]|uniref:Uncharacterized protein n=1 Tax=Medicago truncatula TaxID=3880 RepID=A0A396HTF4_MEDTR|nr:hypothetical protein MtrunA17_Chr5g0422071 [Medicago truncatula]
MNLGEIWWESGGNLAVLGLGSHRPNHVGRDSWANLQRAPVLSKFLWWPNHVGRGFVGKNLHEARAKSRREGIRGQKSPARSRTIEIFVVGQISLGARARAKPRRGAEIPRARLRTRIIKVIPVWIFFSRPGLDLPLPMPSQGKVAFCNSGAKRGFAFSFLRLMTLKIFAINESRVQICQNFSLEVLMMSNMPDFWRTRFVPWMGAHLKKKLRFARFGQKIRINRNVVGFLRNFADPLDVFLLRCLQKISSKFDF